VSPTKANTLPYVVHAKMSDYTISMNQRRKSGIYHENNQPIILNSENNFNFCLRFPISLKGS
jgi:hypothetical protein